MITVQEQFLDGSQRILPAVRFKNPFPVTGDARSNLQHTVRLTADTGNAIIREMQIVIGRQPDGKSPKVGSRTMDLVVPPGETVDVCEEVANVLHLYKCIKCNCLWRFGQPGAAKNPRTVCINPKHPKVVIGGLAPQLQAIDDEGRVVDVDMHPNLVPEAPKYDLNDLHSRVMARIEGGK